MRETAAMGSYGFNIQSYQVHQNHSHPNQHQSQSTLELEFKTILSGKIKLLSLSNVVLDS